jgi:hypothetical protein
MAPEIDTLTDAEIAPAWDGRVGDIEATVTYLLDDDGRYISDDASLPLTDDSAPAPGVPQIVSINAGNVQGGSATDVSVSLQPGGGAVATASYEVQYRLVGNPTWSNATAPAAAGAVIISGFSLGDDIEFQVEAIGLDGVASDFTALQTATVGTDATFIPQIADFAAERLVSGWHFTWDTATHAAGGDLTLSGANIRYRAGAWSAWDDLNPLNTSGLITTSPWDGATPTDDGLYTFGIQLLTLDGQTSDPFLIFAVAPIPVGDFMTDDVGLPLIDDNSSYLPDDGP